MSNTPDLPSTTEPAAARTGLTPMEKLILIGIGIMFWVTNPSMDRHAEVIGAAYRKAHPILTSLVLNPEAAVKVGGTRFSYVLFSFVNATSGDRETWSIGALGMVYVFDSAL